MKQVMAIIFGVVCIIGLVFISYTVWKKNKELDIQLKRANAQYEEASLALDRATTELGDANKKVSELSKDLQGQLKARQEITQRYAELHTKYEVIASQNNIPVDNTGTIVDSTAPDFRFAEGHYYLATEQGGSKLVDLGPDLKFGFHDNRIVISAKLATGVDKQTKQLTPMSDISYKLQLRIKTMMVTTIDPKGHENTYAEMYEVDETGTKVLGKFSTDQFYVVTKDQRAKHMEWWNPHLDAGLVAGYNGSPTQLGGSIGVSLMSYGLTKNDMTWRFIRPGVTLSERVGLDLAPALYNIGEPLPLVSNLWVGPYIGYDFKNTSLGLMLNLVL